MQPLHTSIDVFDLFPRSACSFNTTPTHLYRSVRSVSVVDHRVLNRQKVLVVTATRRVLTLSRENGRLRRTLDGGRRNQRRSSRRHRYATYGRNTSIEGCGGRRRPLEHFDRGVWVTDWYRDRAAANSTAPGRDGSSSDRPVVHPFRPLAALVRPLTPPSPGLWTCRAAITKAASGTYPGRKCR